MKKILLGAVPFLGLAFLVGCGPQPAVDHTVDETAFNDATSLKDVTYLQMSSLTTITDEEGTDRVILNYDCSPTVSFVLEEELDGGKRFAKRYCHKTVDKEGEELYEIFSSTSKTSTTYDYSETRSSASFILPRNTPAYAKRILDSYNLTYVDFTYNNQTSCYVAQKRDTEYSEDLTFTFRFDNKKLAYMKLNEITDDGESLLMEINNTYNIYTPALPPKPQA